MSWLSTNKVLADLQKSVYGALIDGSFYFLVPNGLKSIRYLNHSELLIIPTIDISTVRQLALDSIKAFLKSIHDYSR